MRFCPRLCRRIHLSLISSNSMCEKTRKVYSDTVFIYRWSYTFAYLTTQHINAYIIRVNRRPCSVGNGKNASANNNYRDLLLLGARITVAIYVLNEKRMQEREM